MVCIDGCCLNFSFNNVLHVMAFMAFLRHTVWGESTFYVMALCQSFTSGQFRGDGHTVQTLVFGVYKI